MTHQNNTTNQERKLKVEMKKTSELKEYEKNSRVHTSEQIKKISKSIENFGFNVPILIDSEGTVISGHGRLYAAKHIGLKEVPTIKIEHMSKEKIKAFVIADNKLHDESFFDELTLQDEINEIVKLSLDPEITGFAEDEIKKILDMDEKLKEKIVEIKPMTTTYILIELPNSSDVKMLEDLEKTVKNAGGVLSYGGN